MAIRVGNAAAPRWFDLSLTKLDDYVAFVHECGATSAELVLHAGPADDRIARVHILEEDWGSVFEQFRARGIICHVHAPLDPRFNLARWRTDRTGLQRALQPILRAVSTFAGQQGEQTCYVVHAASSAENEGITREAVRWLLEEFERSSTDVRIALELRKPVDEGDVRFDRRPTSIAAFVRSFDHPKLGICWDLVNDVDLPSGIETLTPERLTFMSLVNHVHLHDAGNSPADGHHPLSNEKLDWRSALRQMLMTDYAGAITLEVRYRHALSQGDPWQVLADSYNRLLSFLDSVSTFDDESGRVHHTHRT